MGLENSEPLVVYPKDDSGSAPPVPTFANEFYDTPSGDISPRTAAAIAKSYTDSPQTGGARKGIRTPPNRIHSPVIPIDDDYPDPIIEDIDDDIPMDIDDDVVVVQDPQPRVPTALDMLNNMLGAGNNGAGAGAGGILHPDSPWNAAATLMDRMAGMQTDADMYGMRAPLEGTNAVAEGYLGPGRFEEMTLAGAQKQSFLRLMTENVVTPDNWRLHFPSKAMDGASPLHYPNTSLEDAIADAKALKMFVIVHIFNRAAESSDFYNMIVSRDTVQGVYADNYIPYYVAMDQPLELSSLSRILSPSLQRRPPPMPLPLVLILASIGGRLKIIGAADSTVDSSDYMDRLLVLRESHLQDLMQDEQLEKARLEKTALVNEQNLEYEMAVRQDEEKARQEEEAAAIRAFEEKEREEAIEAARIFSEQEAARVANDRTSQRQKYIDALNALPAEPTEGKNATIAIRLSDGSKVQRKFNPDSSSLAHLFTFAAGQAALKSTDATFIHASTPDAPWSISDFDLSAQFPARRFTHAQEDKTLRELGLTGQELLMLVDKL